MVTQVSLNSVGLLNLGTVGVAILKLVLVLLMSTNGGHMA